VDVFGMEGDGFGAVGIVRARNEIAARADDFVLRQREFHIEGAEIGEEFGVGVELVAIPGVLPPHADFWKPLADHDEVAFVAGAMEDFGKLIVKGNVKLHGSARSYGLGQRDLENGAVVGIVVVGMDEFHLAGQIARAFDFELANLDAAFVFFVPACIRAGAARSHQANFGHEGGLRLERVEI
jgi:hypothetical protein